MHHAISEIARLIGDRHVLTLPQDKAPYLNEQRGRWRGHAAAIVRPAQIEEVIGIVKIAAAHDMHIIPQGGGTGLVGGQIGFDEEKSLIINMARMNKIRAVDATSNFMVVEAGCVLADIHAAAGRAGRQFPLRLASEGSAQIGGLLATNAGGTHVLRHGMMRDLTLGVEAVFADGRCWNGLSVLRKDNSGYDLKNLLIGSEGTLAILTAAVLRLVPEDHAITTAMVALSSLEEALALFTHTHTAAPDHIAAFELLSERGLRFVLRHFERARAPFAKPHPWYALIDMTAKPILEKTLARYDAVVAQSQQQAAQLWFLRDTLSEVQKKEGASIKHDISVPLSAWPAFTRQAVDAVENLIPNIRPVIFGHLGDGNLHFNLSRPKKMTDEAFLDHQKPINKIIYDLVLHHHGSVSAEHGIGILKREALYQQKGETAMDIMKRIKQALDPDNRLNPNKIFL